MLHNEVINIEESTYQIRSNYCVRRFKLKNHFTNFEVIIKNNGASLISCKMNNGKDELIRTDNDENQINQQQQSNRNQLSVNGFDWQSHVVGLDSISFATSHHKNNSTITYQLTLDKDKIDCLLMLGKLRSNSSNSSIDGHFLHIRGVKLDKLDNNNENLTFTLAGTDDKEFLSFFKSPGRITYQDNKKFYDLVYTLEGLYKEASIVCLLSYDSKRIEITIKNTLNSNYSTQTSSIGSTINSSQSNTQNLCRLRIRINSTGISFLPSSMLEFKCSYKFFF